MEAAATATSTSTYADRRRRAGELGERWPYAAEVMRLYAALLDVQEEAFLAARLDGPASYAEVPGWAAERVVSGVIAATVAAGPGALAGEVSALLYGHDLSAPVAAWLAGEAQSPARAFVGRAAAAPVLEARPDLLPPVAASPRQCPACGGPPQVSVFTLSGEALVTGRRELRCARCSGSWPYARMTCAGCGEEATARLVILADHDVFPHLRADACDGCQTYLLTVDLNRDPAAVPEVDELAALPLAIAAAERGYRKLTPNLVGM